MHKIEQAIQVFLENIDKVDVIKLEPIIEEFGEDCKKALKECLLLERGEEPFRLRMSNIGRPLRSLMLEQKYGATKFDPQQKLRATYGYIWESFLFFLLKASGLDIETQKQVSLDISVDDKKEYKVNGTLDCIIDGEIYDVKSASPWSYNNKFISLETLKEDDPFGYVGQALGYSIADKCHFGGWIVIDKSDGRIKVVPIPKEGYKELAREYLNDFKNKVRRLFFTKDAEMPSCDGVIEETFNKKKTGHKILKKTCEFCAHKYICHPKLQVKECLTSQAQNKPWKHYTHIESPNVELEETT